MLSRMDLGEKTPYWSSLVYCQFLVQADYKLKHNYLLMLDAAHLRAVFYRMGFSDKDIVALSGGHTLVNSSDHCSE